MTRNDELKQAAKNALRDWDFDVFGEDAEYARELVTGMASDASDLADTKHGECGDADAVVEEFVYCEIHTLHSGRR